MKIETKKNLLINLLSIKFNHIRLKELKKLL